MAKLEVYCGPMFARKTTGLLESCIKINKSVGVVIYKPVIDNRFAENDIVTHDGVKASEYGLEVVSKPTDWSLTKEDLTQLTKANIELVGIDEAQFFDDADTIVSLLVTNGFNVICTGLDLDSSGNTFGKMGDLLCLADTVVKCTSDCSLCGDRATRTFRKLSAPTRSKVLVGGGEIYESRCLNHWEQGMQEWLVWLSNEEKS